MSDLARIGPARGVSGQGFSFAVRLEQRPRRRSVRVSLRAPLKIPVFNVKCHHSLNEDKPIPQPEFFDLDERYARLNERDPLVKLHQIIDWEAFRAPLSVLRNPPRKSQAGCKPCDLVLMFKILVLQHLYNVCDDDIEYQICDRHSFCRFLGRDLEDNTPERFEANPSVQSQKDTQARWARQHQATHPSAGSGDHFGYKHHIAIDNQHKLIRAYELTSAEVHDSQKWVDVLSKNTSGDLWADSACRSQVNEKEWAALGLCSHIQKGQRNKPLSEAQKRANTRKSKVRVRVEHVFGLK